MVEGHDLGRYRPLADDLGHGQRVGRRDAQDEGQRIEEVAEKGLQRPADMPAEEPVEEAAGPAEAEVEEGQEAEESDEQGDDAAEELEPVLRPLDNGHHQVLVSLVMRFDVHAQGQGLLRLGHDELGHDDAGRRRDEGGGDEVTGDHRDVLLEQEHVEPERRRGDGAHARCDDRPQLRAGHVGEVGLDDEGRLDADEDVGRNRERLGPADPHRPGEDPGEQPDEEGHDPHVIEGAEKGGEEDDRRQGLEGQGVAERGLAGLIHRPRRQGHPAEDELRAGRGAVEDGHDGLVDPEEDRRAGRKDEDEQADEELESDAPEEGPRIDDFPVRGKKPGDAGQDEDAQEADEVPSGHDSTLKILWDDVSPRTSVRRDGGTARCSASRSTTSRLARPFSGAALTRTRKTPAPSSSTPGVFERGWALTVRMRAMAPCAGRSGIRRSSLLVLILDDRSVSLEQVLQLLLGDDVAANVDRHRRADGIVRFDEDVVALNARPALGREAELDLPRFARGQEERRGQGLAAGEELDVLMGHLDLELALARALDDDLGGRRLPLETEAHVDVVPVDVDPGRGRNLDIGDQAELPPRVFAVVGDEIDVAREPPRIAAGVEGRLDLAVLARGDSLFADEGGRTAAGRLDLVDDERGPALVLEDELVIDDVALLDLAEIVGRRLEHGPGLLRLGQGPGGEEEGRDGDDDGAESPCGVFVHRCLLTHQEYSSPPVYIKPGLFIKMPVLGLFVLLRKPAFL